MDELECMRYIDEALLSVPDELARGRIVVWAMSKHGGPITSRFSGSPEPDRTERGGDSGSGVDGQISGIAKLSASGEVQLTVRDLKAKSANDAAWRLVHVLIWATKKLTGSESASSKASVVPALRRYRCYDANTRKVIARDKGLVRDGDALSLDFPAEQLAEKFVQEMLDPAMEGKWKPGGAKKRAVKSSRAQSTGAN